MTHLEIDRETCIYCGGEATTKDHVPPKSLFRDQTLTHQLITVPSCNSCNLGSSLDDDYFKFALALEHGEESNPEGLGLLYTVLRGLSRPESEKHLHNIASMVRDVKTWSPSGKYLGTKKAIPLQQKRFLSVVARIYRGLYFEKFGKALPDSIDVTPISIREYYERGNLQHIQMIENLLEYMDDEPMVIAGKSSIFQWAIKEFGDEVCLGNFLLLSDNRLLVFAIPRDKLPANLNQESNRA